MQLYPLNLLCRSLKSPCINVFLVIVAYTTWLLINCSSKFRFHLRTSINNATLADKIAKQVQDALRMPKDPIKKALTLEACLQLTKDIHLGRPPLVMQVSTDLQVQYSHKGLDGCANLMHIKGNQVFCNASWRFRGIGHFHNNYTIMLST